MPLQVSSVSSGNGIGERATRDDCLVDQDVIETSARKDVKDRCTLTQKKLRKACTLFSDKQPSSTMIVSDKDVADLKV